MKYLGRNILLACLGSFAAGLSLWVIPWVGSRFGVLLYTTVIIVMSGIALNAIACIVSSRYNNYWWGER